MPDVGPKALANPTEVASRHEQLQAPHVAPLTGFVARLREQRGGDESVPWFDPDSGGVNARILLLSEAPGARAVGPSGPRPAARGSGFISFDNNDETAANVYRLFHEADLPRSWLLAWNIVPWYLGDQQHVRAANSDDVDEALPALRGMRLTS